MNAHDAVIEMLNDAGMSSRQAAKALGRSPGYLTHITNGTSTPNANTLAAVADVCGYDLVIRRRINDQDIIIDPE